MDFLDRVILPPPPDHSKPNMKPLVTVPRARPKESFVDDSPSTPPAHGRDPLTTSESDTPVPDRSIGGLDDLTTEESPHDAQMGERPSRQQAADMSMPTPVSSIEELMESPVPAEGGRDESLSDGGEGYSLEGISTGQGAANAITRGKDASEPPTTPPSSGKFLRGYPLLGLANAKPIHAYSPSNTYGAHGVHEIGPTRSAGQPTGGESDMPPAASCASPPPTPADAGGPKGGFRLPGLGVAPVLRSAGQRPDKGKQGTADRASVEVPVGSDTQASALPHITEGKDGTASTGAEVVFGSGMPHEDHLSGSGSLPAAERKQLSLSNESGESFDVIDMSLSDSDNSSVRSYAAGSSLAGHYDVTPPPPPRDGPMPKSPHITGNPSALNAWETSPKNPGRKSLTPSSSPKSPTKSSPQSPAKATGAVSALAAKYASGSAYAKPPPKQDSSGNPSEQTPGKVANKYLSATSSAVPKRHNTSDNSLNQEGKVAHVAKQFEDKSVWKDTSKPQQEAVPPAISLIRKSLSSGNQSGQSGGDDSDGCGSLDMSAIYGDENGDNISETNTMERERDESGNGFNRGLVSALAAKYASGTAYSKPLPKHDTSDSPSQQGPGEVTEANPATVEPACESIIDPLDENKDARETEQQGDCAASQAGDDTQQSQKKPNHIQRLFDMTMTVDGDDSVLSDITASRINPLSGQSAEGIPLAPGSGEALEEDIDGSDPARVSDLRKKFRKAVHGVCAANRFSDGQILEHNKPVDERVRVDPNGVKRITSRVSLPGGRPPLGGESPGREAVDSAPTLADDELSAPSSALAEYMKRSADGHSRRSSRSGQSAVSKREDGETGSVESIPDGDEAEEEDMSQRLQEGLQALKQRDLESRLKVMSPVTAEEEAPFDTIDEGVEAVEENVEVEGEAQETFVEPEEEPDDVVAIPLKGRKKRYGRGSGTAKRPSAARKAPGGTMLDRIEDCDDDAMRDDLPEAEEELVEQEEPVEDGGGDRADVSSDDDSDYYTNTEESNRRGRKKSAHTSLTVRGARKKSDGGTVGKIIGSRKSAIEGVERPDRRFSFEVPTALMMPASPASPSCNDAEDTSVARTHPGDTGSPMGASSTPPAVTEVTTDSGKESGAAAVKKILPVMVSRRSTTRANRKSAQRKRETDEDASFDGASSITSASGYYTVDGNVATKTYAGSGEQLILNRWSGEWGKSEGRDKMHHEPAICIDTNPRRRGLQSKIDSLINDYDVSGGGIDIAVW